MYQPVVCVELEWITWMVEDNEGEEELANSVAKLEGTCLIHSLEIRYMWVHN